MKSTRPRTPSQGTTTQDSNQDALSFKFQESIVAEKLSEVESLVSEALMRTNGACAGEASSAVEAAVRRARTKANMLPHLDSDLVLSALDEVRTELSILVDVTAANAEVMREVATTSHPGEAPSMRSMSVRTQPGEPVQASTTHQGSTDPASVLTQVEGEDIAGSASELESTAGTANVADVVSAVVAPLRHLASDAMADHAVRDPTFYQFKHSLRMRKARSGDMRVANALDFDECASPRVSPKERGTPKVHGTCIAFGRDAGGEPIKMEPLDKEVDQYAPMSPVCSAAREGRVRIEGRRSEDTGEEGKRHVLVVDEKRNEEHEQLQHEISFGRASSPRWMPTCERGVPPGLHPTAHVDHAGREGHGLVEVGALQSPETLEVQLAEEEGGVSRAQLGDVVHDERWDLSDELKGRLDV